MFSMIKKFTKQTDKFLLFICLLLSTLGILSVSSATHTTSTEGLITRDARVMIIAVALGFVMSLIISMFDHELIFKMWLIIGGVCLVLMVLLFPLGAAPDARSDARCWFKITSTLYFQPSEIVKIGFAVTFAAHCDKVKDSISSFKNVALLCVHAMLFIGLVVLTGDMGSALIFGMMFLAMMFAAGVRKIYFLIGPLLVAAVLPVAWYKVFGTIQRNRILALFYPDLYPDEIYQQNMAVRAMQSGGLWGKGLFKGIFHHVVPENQNDMVFSVVCEELGYIGAVALIIVFVLLIVKILMVGQKSGSFPAKVMCAGIAFMLGSQIMVNIGMCTKVLPVIGITLPFISAGGSSSLCIYLAIGLVLSVKRHTAVSHDDDYRYSMAKFNFKA